MRKARLKVLAVLCFFLIFTYCLLSGTYSQSPVLCVTHQLTYSKPKEIGALYSTAQKRYLHSKLLGEILTSYHNYHEVSRREMTMGKTHRSLTWYCVSDCNGIGDRVKGMYAAFLLSVATNRTFFIHQSDVVQRTMLLEPNAIDWRPLNSCIVIQNDQAALYFGRPGFLETSVLGKKGNFSLELNRLAGSDDIYVTNKMGIFSLIRSIQHSNLSANLHPQVQKLLHLVLHSGEDVKLHAFLSVLHHFLFHLPQNVQTMAELTLNQLQLVPQRFVAVHIRTGFKNRLLGELTFSRHRFARTPESWRGMTECALNISRSRFGKNITVLVASDDKEAKEWVASEYKTRVTMLDIDPVHVSSVRSLGITAAAHSTKAYLDMWVELSVMSKSSAIVSINSGYSEVASHMGSMDPFSLYIYSIQERKCARMCCGILKL